MRQGVIVKTSKCQRKRGRKGRKEGVDKRAALI